MKNNIINQLFAGQLTSLSRLVTLLLTMGLAGCGGGGDGGGTELSYSGLTTQAVITPTNGEPIATNSYQNGMSGNEIGGAVGVIAEAEGTSTGDPRSLTLAHILKSAVDKIDTTTTSESLDVGAVGAAVTETSPAISGTCGGSSVYTITYDDVTGSFSGTFTFNSFCEDNETISGSMSFSGQVNLSTASFSGAITMTFSNLTVSSGGDSFTTKGTITFNDNNAGSIVMTMDLLLHDNTLDKTYHAANYTINEQLGVGYTDITITGRFYDPDHGYVDLQTTTAFRTNNSDIWPSTGVMAMTGNGGTVTLTALSNTQFQVDIDDGVTVTSIIGNWADL